MRIATDSLVEDLTRRIALALVLCLPLAATAAEPGFELEAQTGALWFSRNDVRIPGDGGTRFDMLDLTGTGPDPFLRLEGTWQFAERHAVRLAWAPVRAEGRGQFDRPVDFDGATFAAGTDVRGDYQFDTWRLTYRWTFHESERWEWGVGATLLVRDARIALSQGATSASDSDLGLVPLLHVRGAWHLDDRYSVVLDIDGAAAPQGRAVDAALLLRRQWPSGWYLSGGYRTLEGGADNDEVYTFAWQHYAVLGAGYRF
ncbi:MAG TPA: hypothetical protein VLA56_14920 [Pseudomonadales bacterium]|nr:hypothetical protein [Pseudomonadales bacterium]